MNSIQTELFIDGVMVHMSHRMLLDGEESKYSTQHQHEIGGHVHQLEVVTTVRFKKDAGGETWDED